MANVQKLWNFIGGAGSRGWPTTEAAGVYGCFAYTFFSPGFPHSSDPALDLDMAGFGLVKTEADQLVDWEPKLAFHKVAERYRHLRDVGAPAPKP